MKTSRFILALVSTVSRWNTCSATEKQKLLQFHIQSLQDEIEDLKFDEFSICLKLFSQLLHDSLPEYLNKDDLSPKGITETNRSLDSNEELLSGLVQLLGVFMKNYSCQKYLSSLEGSDECFPVVAHLVLLLLKLTATNILERSLRASACSTLSRSFCPSFSLSVARCVLPGLVSKLCKLGSESFHEQHLVAIHVLECLRIFIMKCFPIKSEDAVTLAEPRWGEKYTSRENFLSIFKKQNILASENASEETQNEKNSTEVSVLLEKTVSCLHFMLNHKEGPVFHPHADIRRATAHLLQDTLLLSQVGMAKNLKIFLRSLCRLCCDLDTETRLLSIKTLEMYQERIGDVASYDLNRYREEEISDMLQRAMSCNNFDELEDDDFIIFFGVAEFLINSWNTPILLEKIEDIIHFFIRSGQKFFKDLFSRMRSEESNRIFAVLQDVADHKFEAEHFLLRRYFACIDHLGRKGALEWFFPLLLRISETQEDNYWKIIATVVSCQMFLGAMKMDPLDGSCLRYFFPELIDLINGLMQKLSTHEDTEDSSKLFKSFDSESRIYLLLFSAERVILPNSAIFRDYLLKSLISFASLMGHPNMVIASETRRILDRIVRECGYDSVVPVFRKYLNYLIDVICENFIRDGLFYPALQVLLNTDEELTKDCVILAAKELMMLMETIPYCDSLEASRLLKLVECTMKRCAPKEQVPLSKSFPYKRALREPGLYSEPLLLVEKLHCLRMSLTDQAEMNEKSSSKVESLLEEENTEERLEGPLLTSGTLSKDETTESDIPVEDFIISDLAEKTIMCCIELLPENEIREKTLCLKTIASSLDVLAINSKKLLPVIPSILNAVNKELTTWNVSVSSEHPKSSINDDGRRDSLVFICRQSEEESLSIKQYDSRHVPNIVLLDGFCEVIAQVIRYTGDFSKSTICSVALPKLVHILQLLVSKETKRFWESTLHSGYALSSFRCLELITSLEVTLVSDFIEDLVEIIVPILSLYSSRKHLMSRNNKLEQRYEEKLKILYDLSSRILTNLLSTDPSTTWYCFYRKVQLR